MRLGINWDSDGMLAFHYAKGESTHRRVLFQVKDGIVFIRHPVSKNDVPIGYANELGANLVILIPMRVT